MSKKGVVGYSRPNIVNILICNYQINLLQSVLHLHELFFSFVLPREYMQTFNLNIPCDEPNIYYIQFLPLKPLDRSSMIQKVKAMLLLLLLDQQQIKHKDSSTLLVQAKVEVQNFKFNVAMDPTIFSFGCVLEFYLLVLCLLCVLWFFFI